MPKVFGNQIALDQRVAERLAHLKAEALESLLLKIVDPKDPPSDYRIEDTDGVLSIRVRGVIVGKLEVIVKGDHVVVQTSQVVS